MLPTFGNVAVTFHLTTPPTVQFPSIDIELKQGAARQRVEVPAPLPPSARPGRSPVHLIIWDKGKAAVICSETTATTPDGLLLWTQKRSIYARGEGGIRRARAAGIRCRAGAGARIYRSRCRFCFAASAASHRSAGTATPLHSIPTCRCRRLSRSPFCMACAPMG